MAEERRSKVDVDFVLQARGMLKHQGVRSTKACRGGTGKGRASPGCRAWAPTGLLVSVSTS